MQVGLYYTSHTCAIMTLKTIMNIQCSLSCAIKDTVQGKTVSLLKHPPWALPVRENPHSFHPTCILQVCLCFTGHLE